MLKPHPLLRAALAAGVVALASSQLHRNSKTPGKALLEQTAKRWTELGFTTRLTSVNGVALHVAEGGQGDAIVLLHGYPQSGEIWRFIAPELARTHRVIVVDLRGMGLSEAAPAGYDLANVAEDIHQVVRSMGISKVKLAGHDWGGAVAAVYALRYRDEVTHLTFLESALAGAGFEAMWDFSKPNGIFTFVPLLLMGAGNGTGPDITSELIRGRELLFLQHLWDTFTGDKEVAPFVAWKPYVAAMSRPGIVASSAAFYRAAYQSASQVQSLIQNKLEIPVLAISGEKGIGAMHEKFVTAFAGNIKENIILAGAGHFLAEERPVEVNAALAAFF